MTSAPRHRWTAAELADQLAAERAGAPYLLLRDGRGVQRLVALREPVLTVGRDTGVDVALPWDLEVSRAHARLERVGGRWTVLDDGLSRNGTFVQDERLHGRRTLSSGDVLRVGRTELTFRDPGASAAETLPAAQAAELVVLTPAQQRVLVALCRPVARGEPLPPANRDVAAELHLSVEAVRSHLKGLFTRLDVPDLPQQHKRLELVRRALALGLVGRQDLER